jgi:hypothetical protein
MFGLLLLIQSLGPQESAKMRCSERIEICEGRVVLYCKLEFGHAGDHQPPEHLAEVYRRIEQKQKADKGK